MEKKYELPENEPRMVSEPVMAVPVEMVQHKMPVHNYSIQEIEERLSNAVIAKKIARTLEEYEDMKAHDFYSKGTPFPEQPQTWDEVWQELDNTSDDSYLDEEEHSKTMEKLWSVLA